MATWCFVWCLGVVTVIGIVNSDFVLGKSEKYEERGVVEEKVNQRALDPFADGCIKAHNKIRAYHSSPDVTWDSNLAKGCEQWAKGLVGQLSLSHSDTTYGENLFMAAGSPDPKKTCADAVYDWYSEVKKYPSYSNNDYYSGIGHFSQCVWKATKKIGCGIASGPITIKGTKMIQNVICCRYNPAGNYKGQFMANVLKPNPNPVFEKLIKSPKDLC